MFYRTFIRIIIISGIAAIASGCLKVPQFDVFLRETQMTVSENTGSVGVEFYLPDGPRNREVEIAYRFGGTAVEGKDYTSREERYIFIASGEESTSFLINLINNIDQDGPKTIVVAIILVVQNGNTIFQGAQNQSLTIQVNDDDCSPYIAGEWTYTASYFMYSEIDTVAVGQDNEQLDSGENPVFSGDVSIMDPQDNRNYFITDMFAGMFSELDITTPCPLYDACGVLTGPNDGSVLLMQELPAYLNGQIIDANTINLEFKYVSKDDSGGGFGSAVLTRK
jgi:hypothetical protein